MYDMSDSNTTSKSTNNAPMQNAEARKPTRSGESKPTTKPLPPKKK